MQYPYWAIWVQHTEHLHLVWIWNKSTEVCAKGIATWTSKLRLGGETHHGGQEFLTHKQEEISTKPAIIHSKEMTRRQCHEKLQEGDSGDDHRTVLFIFSPCYTNMLHEKGNTVALNYILAQTLIPIPCFRECRLDILLCLVQTPPPSISAWVSWEAIPFSEGEFSLVISQVVTIFVHHPSQAPVALSSILP